ncbi:hypothetical protein D3C85_1319910 [compost metagenome]
MEVVFGSGSPTDTSPPTSPKKTEIAERPDIAERPETYTGAVIRSQENIDYLNHRDRSAADSMPPAINSTADEDRQASAEAIAGALSRAPIKVENQLGITLQLDGQALESKIMQVNERQNHEALGDFTATTER